MNTDKREETPLMFINFPRRVNKDLHKISFAFILSALQRDDPGKNDEVVLFKTSLRLIMWQAILGMLPVLAYALLANSLAGLAALYGLTICLITNFMFALFLFRHHGAQAVKQIVRGLYLGEVIKYSITVVMFWAAVVVLHLPFLPLITSYIVAQLAWYATLLIREK
jgi:ATP synthase protein I